MRLLFLLLSGLVFTVSALGQNADKVLEAKLMAVLDNYMDAVNRIEIEAVTDTYHFPHYRIVNHQVVVWHTAEQAMPLLGLPREQQARAMRDALGPDWQRTDWAYRKILSHSETKAHFETELVRYNSNGDEISRFESLYILTKDNGRWAIKARSSFAPR